MLNSAASVRSLFSYSPTTSTGGSPIAPPNNPLVPEQARSPSPRMYHRQRYREHVTQLHEQNEELQARIHDLDSRVRSSEASARTRLDKLLREISSLKAELELSEARNAELEAERKAVERGDNRSPEARRREREERLKALKAKATTSGTSDDVIKDFSPSASFTSKPTRSKGEDSLDDSTALDDTPDDSSLDETTDSPANPAEVLPISETLLSQMENKLLELESVNSELNEQKNHTDAELKKMLEEMADLQRSLEIASNDDCMVEFEYKVDDVDGREDVTLKFSSPKKGSVRKAFDSLQSVIPSGAEDDPFTGGTNAPSTTPLSRSWRFSPSREKALPHTKKNRKAINPMMFVDPAQEVTNDDVFSDASLTPRESKFTFPNRDNLVPSSSSWLMSRPSDATRLSKETSSSSLRSTDSDLPLQGHSLESELGSQFGDDWARSVNSSLFRGLSEDEMTNTLEHRTDGDGTAIDMSPSGTAIAALREALDPVVQGHRRSADEHILPLSSLSSAPVDTFYLLDKAIRARPTEWADNGEGQRHVLVEGGVGFSPSPHLSDEGKDPWDSYSEQGSTDYAGSLHGGSLRRKDSVRRELALSRLAEASKRRRTPTTAPISEGAAADTSVDTTITLVQPEEEDDTQKVSKADSSEIIADQVHAVTLNTFLQIWLLLQFAVVVVVFLCIAVKKGPAVVMREKKARLSL
jgi:hypothetical protein